MEPLDHFVMADRRAVFCPRGSFAFDEVVTMVRAAITLARNSQALELLVDTRELTGFPVPGTLARFLTAVEWAVAANGNLRLAMVARPEMIDSEKFGVTVAANRMLISNIFPTVAEAQAWLAEGNP